MSRILLSIIRKEFWHILRDKQTLMIIVLMPILMLYLYGYAITLEMREIKIAVSDQSKTPQSRALIDLMAATDFFRLTLVDLSDSKLEELFMQRKVRSILVIPEDFVEQMQSQPKAKIQLLVDASDPNAANYINKYLQQITASYNYRNNPELQMAFAIEPRMLYNPDMKSSYFFVPGLIAVILLLICALLTSITIVREKEVGTMEQILVSPVHPIHVIIGKVVPYIVLGFVDATLVLIIGHLWFDVPILGSPITLAFTLLLYILTGLSLGLLISTITKSQQVAMLAALLATILPSIMLSGFIFPVTSMPLIFQWVSKVIPATHFLQIIRGIMLKGNGLSELMWQMVFLALLSTFFISISLKKFKTTLE